MKRRASSAVSLLVAALLVLTGCTEPETPEQLPPGRWDHTSPDPTHKAAYQDAMLDQLPAEAKTDTPDAGIVVATTFIEQHPRLFQEGGSELFAYLSMVECVFCAQEQERALRTVAEYGYQEGGDFTVAQDLAENELDTESFGEPTLIVTLSVYEAPFAFRNAAGEVTEQGGDLTFLATFALQLRDGIWRVRAFETRLIEDEPGQGTTSDAGGDFTAA